MFTLTFWKRTCERAIATAAEAALAVLTVDGVVQSIDLDVAHIASIAGLSALAAVLKGLVASQTGDSASPSFVDEPGDHAAPEA
jgi:hypothetical protein